MFSRRKPQFLSRLITRIALSAGLVGMLTGFSSIEALFAPKPELWERWTAHNPSDAAIIDHSVWSRILKQHLSRDGNGINRFSYAKTTAGDIAALSAYVEKLSNIPISNFNRDEQKAFWINLYNALTVKVVLAAYPVKSIRDIDISPGLFARGPWDKKLIEVEGEAVSLNDIEHRILRPAWQDPRLHYALNCAAIGCPNLRNVAFTSSNTENLLEAAARDYVNNPRGADIVDETLTVSSIYVWFAEDFGKSDAAIIAHLRRYAEAELLEKLAGIDAIGGMAYNWGLNDAPNF